MTTGPHSGRLLALAVLTAALAARHACAEIPYPLAYWPCDETSGAIVCDQSTNHLDGVLKGNTGFAAGKYGKAKCDQEPGTGGHPQPAQSGYQSKEKREQQPVRAQSEQRGYQRCYSPKPGKAIPFQDHAYGRQQDHRHPKIDDLFWLTAIGWNEGGQQAGPGQREDGIDRYRRSHQGIRTDIKSCQDECRPD